MIAHASAGLTLVFALQAPDAFAQSQPITVIQDAPYPPPAPPAPATRASPVKRDPSEILGIRIESNGALITGPMNARRVYIPLDRPIIPEGMRGAWARSADICSVPSEQDEAATQGVAKDNVLVTDRVIVAKQRWQILQTFVPLPSTFTLAMLQSGRRLVLPARKHKKAAEVLVIFSAPDGQRNYSKIRLLSEGQTIDFSNRDSHETGVRCARQIGDD